MGTKWLFIVTRMGAQFGNTLSDEFVSMWNQETNEPLARFEGNNRKVTVFHGYREAFPNKVQDLTAAIQGEIDADTDGRDLDLGILIHGNRKQWQNLMQVLNDSRIEFVDFFGTMFANDYTLYQSLAREANKVDFDEAFDAIWERFAGNPVLEAKLEFLHLCLTPGGAALILGENCPEIISLEKAAFWSDQVAIDDQQKSVEEAINMLTKFNRDECFSTAYIKILSAIRSSLFEKCDPQISKASSTGN